MLPELPMPTPLLTHLSQTMATVVLERLEFGYSGIGLFYCRSTLKGRGESRFCFRTLQPQVVIVLKV